MFSLTSRRKYRIAVALKKPIGVQLADLFFKLLPAAYCLSILFTAVSTILITTNSPAHASGGSYAASDILGRFDNSGNPSFVQADINAVGFGLQNSAAIDSVHHRMFVADGGNNRILVFNLDSSDHISSYTASYVLGQPNMLTGSCNYPNDTVTAASLCNLDGLAYDAVNNRLFVADAGNYRVLEYDLSGGISNDMNASHVLGQTNFTNKTCNTGGISAATLCFPESLTYDSANKRLFVNDTNNFRLLEYDLSGGIADGMSASHVLGQTNFTNNTCNNGGISAATLCYNYDSLYNASNNRLFVMDSSNNRVLEYDLSGGIADGMSASHVLGQTNFTNNTCNNGGISAATLCILTGITYDSANSRLFVNDMYNNRVLEYDLSGGITDGMSASHVLGQTNFSNSGCNEGVSINITANSFCYMQGVTYDPTSNQLWVVDTDNRRVLDFDLSGGLSDNMNASNLLGQVSNNSPVFNTGNANNLDDRTTDLGGYPESTYVDTVHHRLFVADCSQASRVAVYALDSNNNIISHHPTYILGSMTTNGTSATTFHCAEGLAYDPGRNLLFVGDNENNRVIIFDLSSGISNGMAASYVLGQNDLNSNAENEGAGIYPPSATSMLFPYGGLAFDPTTNYLYVSDSGNERVLVYDTTNLSDGMAALYAIGAPDLVSESGSTDQVSLDYPYGLALDPARHELFVADDGPGRVLVFDTSHLSSDMPASYVLGPSDFTSGNGGNNNGNGITSTSMDPTMLAYDPIHQYLFVGDDHAYRILVFDLSGGITDGMSPMGVLGVPDFTTSGKNAGGSCFTSQTQICDPQGLDDYYDTSNNRLYVSDAGNDRVMIYNFARLPAVTVPNATTGLVYDFNPGAYTQGNPTYTVTSGSLPPGLSLSAATGDISGIPTTHGNYTVGLTVADDNGNAGIYKDSQTYSITVLSAGSSSGGSSSNPSSPNKGSSGSTKGKSTSVSSSSAPSASPTATTTTATTTSRATSKSPRTISHSRPALHTYSLFRNILLFFPWLLFILLGLTSISFAYRAYQEQKRDKLLRAQLAWEKSLSEQKQNFITLSSHYFRTPLTIISGGIELATSGASEAVKTEFFNLTNQLKRTVDDLITTVTGPASISSNPSAAVISSPQARTEGIPAYLIIFLVGAYLLVALADIILSRIDLYNLKYIVVLEQFAALLLASALLLGARRSWQTHKLLSDNQASLVSAQADLDRSRNALIQQSLIALEEPIRQIKAKLNSFNDPNLTKPALNGISRFESMLQKFNLITLLKSDPNQAVPKQNININEMLDIILPRYQSTVKAKQLSIKLDLRITTVYQNRALLTEAVDSLISNAVKYGPEHSTVIIQADNYGNQVNIRVADQGIGIAEDKLSQIFEPFSRAENASANFNQEGMGLSLYMDKIILQYLGGKIDISAAISNRAGTIARLLVPSSV